MTKQDWKIQWPERICGGFLFLYPAAFRERFGQEILAVVRECCQERLDEKRAGKLLVMWLGTIKDFAFSILRERAEELLSGLNSRLSFRALPDFVTALLAIGVNVALWAQAVAFFAVGTPKVAGGAFIITWALCALGLGVMCLLRSLVLRRDPWHTYLCLELNGDSEARQVE